MGLKKKYTLHGGVILILDGITAPPRYHPKSRTEEPTVELLFQKGSITQEAASKAANRVMLSTAGVSNTRVQLCTRSAVMNWEEAEDFADTFVEEVDKILKSRDREVAARRANKAKSREGYNYTPPGHLMHR